MTDRKKSHDEEYQFPQDDYEDDLHAEVKPPVEHEEEEQPFDTSPPPQPTGIGGIWANHKRIIVILGVVVVVVVVFGVLRHLHKAPPAAPVVAEQPVQTVVQPVVDPQLVSEMTDLKQDSINNNVAIRQMQRQVQQLDSSLNQARVAQQQLSQSMMVLVGQVQKLTQEVKAQAQPKRAPAVKAAPKAVEPVITFQLRAVVPGRAWIVGSDGQSHSVAVGDHIPQYGTVQSINADEGIVVTSSGKTIRFQ